MASTGGFLMGRSALSNYIHWIEDLLSSDIIIGNPRGNGDVVRGFDIGTGVNCIYPLLGASLCGWNFVVSDMTNVALEWAERNVTLISELIEIRKVDYDEKSLHREESLSSPSLDSESNVDLGEGNVVNKYRGPPILVDAVKDGENFDFCMCNPPFFETMDEAGLYTKTAFGGTPEEMVCPGGE